jgi:hypothetical protein
LDKIDQLIQAAIAQITVREIQILKRILHQLYAQDKLVKEEIQGLTEAVRSKAEHTEKSKFLPLTRDTQVTGGATFWSPRKIKEARDRAAANKQAELEREAEKAEK